MNNAEQATRIILGPLNNDDKDIYDLLGDMQDRRDHLSDGEKVMVDLAFQFWNGSGTTTLAEALRWLDGQGKINLCEAVAVACGRTAVPF